MGWGHEFKKRGHSMTSAETTIILNAARDLFGLTDAELGKILSDPEQLLAISDMLTASQ